MHKSSQKIIAFFMLVLAIAFGAFLTMQGNNFIWYWVFGLAFGFVLQRSRVCFVSAASEPLITGSTEQFRAILIGILVSSFGIAVLKYLSSGMLDMLGVSTISLPLIIGAFIFGIGMILSGCCSSGMFIRLAEGYSVHVFTFIGVIAGYLFANSHYQSLWGPFIVNAPAIFLPLELGWTTGVAVHILIIVLLYLVAYKQEQDISSSNSTTYLKGALCLGLFNIAHYILLESGWSITGAFFWFGELFQTILGNASTVASNPEEMYLLAAGPNIRNLGLFIGAFISIFSCAGFRFKKIRSFKQAGTALAGGLLMGYGACIAGGCNVSAFFTAAASLSLSAWVFMIFLFAGTVVGVKILYKLL